MCFAHRFNGFSLFILLLLFLVMPSVTNAQFRQSTRPGSVHILNAPPPADFTGIQVGDTVIYPDEGGSLQSCTILDATLGQVICREGSGGSGIPGPQGPPGPPGPPGEPGNPGEGTGGLIDVKDCGDPNPTFVLRSSTDPSIRVIPCNDPAFGGLTWRPYPDETLAYMKYPLVQAMRPVTITDSGDEDPGALTLDPTDFATEATDPIRGVILLTCADTQSCTLTLDETSNPPEGTQIELINVATPLITLTDQADVLEVGGAITLGEDHVLRLRRVLGRWVRNDPPALLAGTDTQVLYFDGAAPAGDADLTFNDSTKVLTASGGFVSACDPATEVCLNEAVNEATSPTDPTDTAVCRWGFVAGELEWFCGGGELRQAGSGSGGTQTKCFLIEQPVAAETFLFFRAEAALTITAADCLVNATTSAVLTVQECDANGGSCTTVEALTCATTNTADNGIDNASVDAGDWLRVLVGTVTGTVGHANVCVIYTE